MTRLQKKRHHTHSHSKRLEHQSKSLPEQINQRRICKIGSGYQCLLEIELSGNKLPY